MTAVSIAGASVVAVTLVLFLLRGRGLVPTAVPIRVATTRRRRSGRLASGLAGRWSALRRRLPDSLASLLGGAIALQPTEEQEEVARVVRLATRTAGDVHHRLRPMLDDIARGRLAAHGVDLDTQPAQARALLGDQLADLLRADREMPSNYFSPGIPLDEIASHIARLEAL